MKVLVNILNAVLASHTATKYGLFAVTIAFITWVNYGGELDRNYADRSAPEPTENVSQVNSQTTSSPSYSSTQAQGFVPASDPMPSGPSLEEQLLKSDAEALSARIQKLSSDIGQLEADLNGWHQRVGELATNDSGRRIANSPECLMPVASLIKTEPTSFEDVAALKERLRVLGDAAFELRKRDDYATIQNHFSDSRTLYQGMRERTDKARLSLSLFEKRCQLLSPSNMTLSDAIKLKEESDAVALASDLAESQKRHNERLATLKKESQAKLNEMELEREQARAIAEEGARVAAIALEKKNRELAAEKRQLEAEFERDLPEINHYLGRLFPDGYTQPKTSAGYFEQSETKGPVSLSAFKSTGALGEKISGLGSAYGSFVLVMNSESNDRPGKSPYPGFNGGEPSPELAAIIRPGYTLLKKYQHLLVEKGYLAP